MAEPTFETKCLTLQTVYRKLRNDPDFEDFAYEYGFELSLADTIASGKMIELSAGGIQVVERAYSDFVEAVQSSDNPSALLRKVAR